MSKRLEEVTIDFAALTTLLARADDLVHLQLLLTRELMHRGGNPGTLRIHCPQRDTYLKRGFAL